MLLPLITENMPRKKIVGKQNQEISLDLIKKIVKWDKKNQLLKDYKYRFIADIAEGKKSLSNPHKKIALWNLEKG